jgi:hypothetical protein
MRYRLIIRIILVTAFIAGGLLVLRSAPSKKAAPGQKECLDECSRPDGADGAPAWDNLSHQFFSTF